MPHISPEPKLRRRQLLIIGFVAVLLYAVLPQLTGFHDSLRLLRHPEWSAVVAALALTILSYLAAAGTYCLLARAPLNYANTVLVQVASMFVNRLLPAGIGAIGVNFIYLRHSRHTASQAAAVVAANNLVGLLGHALLLSVVFIFAGGRLAAIHRTVGQNHPLIILVVAALVAVAILATVGSWRSKVIGGLRAIVHQLALYRNQPERILGGLLTSITVTLCTIGALWFCLSALQIHLSLITVLLVFSFGLAIGTVTPTPGGLGGMEAGLLAGLIAYNVPADAALAAVLLYRLLTYWLSLVAGALAFFAAQHRGLLRI